MLVFLNSARLKIHPADHHSACVVNTIQTNKDRQNSFIVSTNKGILQNSLIVWIVTITLRITLCTITSSVDGVRRWSQLNTIHVGFTSSNEDH